MLISVLVVQIQFLTAHSTQNKSVILVPINFFIHYHPTALFFNITGSGTVLRHTWIGALFFLYKRVDTQFNDIPGSGS